MTETLLLVLFFVTLFAIIAMYLCLKVIKGDKIVIENLRERVNSLATSNDALKLRVQFLEEANAKANSIKSGDDAINELSKPRQKRTRKSSSTGN